jgi:hypothetical protein
VATSLNHPTMIESDGHVDSLCHLRILHRFSEEGTLFCSPGEEIWAVVLVTQDKEIPLKLGLALRLVADYLARTRHIPQSATQIAAGLRYSAFHLKHGHRGGISQRRKISRSFVREYVKRLRQALEIAFLEAGVAIDARRILLSHATTGTEILYQLKAVIEWVHIEGGESCIAS